MVFAEGGPMSRPDDQQRWNDVCARQGADELSWFRPPPQARHPRAKARLKVVVPVTLALIFLLLFTSSGSASEAALVMLAAPFSLVGAFWLLHYHLSVAVWVGLIALAGLDA